MKILVFKEGETDFIAEWIAGLPARARLRIETVLAYLASERIWRNNPYIKKLTDCDDVHEIIIKCDNIQYRPLGCYGPGGDEFTILIGAQKKGRVWTPHDARGIAKKRCKLIHANTNRRYVGDYNSNS